MSNLGWTQKRGCWNQVSSSSRKDPLTPSVDWFWKFISSLVWWMWRMESMAMAIYLKRLTALLSIWLLNWWDHCTKERSLSHYWSSKYKQRASFISFQHGLYYLFYFTGCILCRWIHYPIPYGQLILWSVIKLFINFPDYNQ